MKERNIFNILISTVKRLQREEISAKSEYKLEYMPILRIPEVKDHKGDKNIYIITSRTMSLTSLRVSEMHL